jgi:hypothetical protein
MNISVSISTSIYLSLCMRICVIICLKICVDMILFLLYLSCVHPWARVGPKGPGAGRAGWATPIMSTSAPSPKSDMSILAGLIFWSVCSFSIFRLRMVD